MTIDERLSVELIASLQQDVEKESRKTTLEIRKLARLVHVIVLDHESRLVALKAKTTTLPRNAGVMKNGARQTRSGRGHASANPHG